jgi:methylase of polypeptide subunit release factors
MRSVENPGVFTQNVAHILDGTAQNGRKFDGYAWCECCGIAMIAGRQGKRFCGDPCRKAAAYRRKLLAARGAIPTAPVLHCGPFQAYQAAYAGKIDVIIADPPYARGALAIYQDLATFARTTLAPCGWLLCLTGWGIDLDVRLLFNQCGLEFITVCKYNMPEGVKTTKWVSSGKRTWNQFDKPLLWYQQPGPKTRHRRAGTSDRIDAKIVGANTQDRDVFHWQQCVEAFKQILWNYTNPQDVICDPCMGSGTTLVAAAAMHRPRIIGIEQDPTTYHDAKARIEQAWHKENPHA